MKILTLVINLKGSNARLESVSAMLNNEAVAWEVIDAVDGRTGDPEGHYIYDNTASLIRHDRPMSSGEKGCFLSQIKSLEYFLSTSATHLILFEDDVAIPKGTIQKLEIIAKKLDEYTINNWDTLNFGHPISGYQSSAFKVGDIEINHSFFPPCGLPGQMWTRQGATCFLNSKFGSVLMGPVDREMRSFFARRGKTFVPSIPLTSRVSFYSEIDQKTDRWLVNGTPYKTSVRCKVVRHFPDYLNANLNMTKTWAKKNLTMTDRYKANA